LNQQVEAKGKSLAKMKTELEKFNKASLTKAEEVARAALEKKMGSLYEEMDEISQKIATLNEEKSAADKEQKEQESRAKEAKEEFER
jgi:hypothetical protein